VTHQVIEALQKEAIPVQQSCRVLEVSRSAFYEAKRRVAEPVICKESLYLKAVFLASHQSYGSRRMVTAMANEGFQMGRFRVRSLMRKAALKPVWKRKFIHTTDSKHDLPIAANVLNRQFNPPAPDLAYVSDITYIRTGAGWLYLATVLDLYKVYCQWRTRQFQAAQTLNERFFIYLQLTNELCMPTSISTSARSNPRK
jgi:putative transposase